MKPEEINKALAEKVMGWHETKMGTLWLDSRNEIVMGIRDWDPYTRIDHAMMCLAKFEYWILQRSGDKYYCRVGTCFDGPGRWTERLTESICLAALKAVEEVDSEKK